MNITMRTLAVFALILSLMLVGGITSAAPTHGASHIDFNGVYQSEQVKDYFYYVRFFQDGTVITVTSKEPPTGLSAWFNKTYYGAGRGTYTINDGHVRFAATSSAGTLEYSGIIQGDVIVFHMHSFINGVKKVHHFHFVKDVTAGG